MATQVGMNPDTLIWVAEWLIKVGVVLKKIKDFLSHPLIKYSLLVLVASYLLFWLGFTNDLLFMTPFR